MNMFNRWRTSSVALFIVLTLAWRVEAQARDCVSTQTCGSNSLCQNGTCSCASEFVSPSGSHADCISLTVPNVQCTPFDASCIYCGSISQGPCLSCTASTFLSGTSCINFCSSGFQLSSVEGTSLVVRVCAENPTVTTDSLPLWAIILIAVVSAVIFLVIVGAVLGFALFILLRSTQGQFDIVDDGSRGPANDLRTDSNSGTLRTKRSNSFSYERQVDKMAMVQHNPNFAEEIEGDDETVFFHKLDYLRSQAEVFLKMLNDMRRRLKEIPVDSAAAQQYRNVMQDVTRLLYMLNKKRSSVIMPADGLQLMVWSEQILERYLMSQGVTLQRDGTKSTNRLSILGPQDETNF